MRNLRQRFNASFVRLLLITGMALAGAPAAGAQDSTKEPAGTTPAIFYLDIKGRVMRADVDGTRSTVIASELGFGPDGIAVDRSAGHVYWTSMGKPDVDDGTVTRADLDGGNVTTIVPAGGTFTPKQLAIDPQHRKLYWSDREGMRVMRADLDGSHIETLVNTGMGDRKDQSAWCVGIALDVARAQIYWTQKGRDNAGQGSILRAGMDIPAGEHPMNRSDIEVLFANLPEPIDLQLDLDKRFIYWTDRGDNTVSRAPMDAKTPLGPGKRTDRAKLVNGLHEAIGITLDLRGNRMFYTSLGGEVGVADLDGGNARILLTGQGLLTGIAFVDVPNDLPRRAGQ
jgi:sugar lactone lactonase YvrE